MDYSSMVGLRELPVVRERGACCDLPAVDATWAARTSELLKALADPTRLTMLAALWQAQEPICICDFTAGLNLSQPTISHHMAKLKQAGLVQWTKHGIWRYYSLRSDFGPAERRLLAALLGK